VYPTTLNISASPAASPYYGTGHELKPTIINLHRRFVSKMAAVTVVPVVKVRITVGSRYEPLMMISFTVSS
jgi:hypothetical protein